MTDITPSTDPPSCRHGMHCIDIEEVCALDSLRDDHPEFCCWCGECLV